MNVARCGRRGGWTLVEIMIAVVLFLLVATIAVVGLLRARITAYEQLALASLRTMTKACQMFYLARQAYPNTLLELATPPPYLNSEFVGDGTTVMRQGYRFTYGPAAAGQRFTLRADPAQFGHTGTRYFYTDETGVIRVDLLGPADAADGPVP